MANEIITADLITNGGLEAAVMSDIVLSQLYDPTDLSAVMTRIPWRAAGGGALNVVQDAVPGAYATVAEAAAVSNSAYTTDEFALTPSRYARRYEVTDLVPMSGAKIDLDGAAANLVKGVALTLTDLLCALFTGLSQSVGNDTTACTVDSIFDGMFNLNTNNNYGRYSLVLGPTQMNDFRSSLRAESGAVQFREVTYETLAARGPGYQGEWSNVDFWQSDSVPASGGGLAGAIMSQGAFAYCLADPRGAAGQLIPEFVYLANEFLLLEKYREPASGMTAIIANIYPAVSEAEDLRGCQIITS